MVLAGCSSDPEDDGPAEVLTEYEDARNARDFEAMRALYADDAVITGHPLVDRDPSDADVDEILALEEERWRDGARADEQIRFVDVEVSGDTATFVHLFFNDSGDCWSTDSDEITVQDGTITRYAWGLGAERDPELVAAAGVFE